MKREDFRVFSLFASTVRKQFPSAHIWAFGSRVKENFSKDSDLDVCVVVDTLDDIVDRRIIDIAWEIGLEHDRLISTLTYSSEEFEKGPCSQSSIVQTILREGVAA